MLRSKPWLLACALVVTPAWAQESAADLAMARELGTEGLRLAESGNCAAAVEKLSRAEKLHHAPTTLGRLGECEVALGRVVEGTEDLRRVAREHMPAHSPPVFVAAQARARKVLEQALPRIAKVRIDVAGPAASDVTLKIDGAPVSNAAIGVERPFDPGAHTIEATAEGYKTGSTQVQIAEGGSQAVTLTLVAEPKVVREEPRPKPVTTTRNYVPAWVAFGLAGASAIAGGVFGGVAIAKKNDLVATCGGTSCSPAQRSAFDELSTFATVSTVTFVIAGVAAIAGVVLVAAAPKRTVETVSLRVAPSGLWLGGTF